MHIRLAAPSCVLPARVGPNCLALASMVREVGLMLLETKDCLEYDDLDLPQSLAALDLSYHAHLPVDLPWELGVGNVALTLRTLVDKVAFLNPWGYVLHPPDFKDLAGLCTAWPEARHLCLENIRGQNLHSVWQVIREYNLGVCLDVGHLVSYGQQEMLRLPGFFEHVRIMHVYGGECASGHLSLEHLDQALLRDLLFQVGSCVLVVELFAWDTWMHSVSLLRSWLEKWGIDFD